MAEALDLIEIVIKEKSVDLEREAKVMERNSKLEVELAHAAEVHTAKMQEEIAKLKDVHKHDVKKYLLKIKELKSKLEENKTLLDQSKRNSSSMEVQLEQLGKHTEDLMKKSSTKIPGNLPLKSNSDQTFKHADHECNFCNNMFKFQHNFELKQLREEITNLKNNLAISNDKLQQIQQQNPNLKLDEERTEDMVKRCNHLESQLIEATNDKESLATELKSLRTSFDFEIWKRDDERRTLENKIRELEINLQKEMYTRENKSGTSTSPVQVSSQHCAVTTDEATLVLRIENMDEKWRSLLNENLKEQESSITKIKELRDYIKTSRDISERLIPEVKSLARDKDKYFKFYKALYSKNIKQNEIIRTLKTKNDELQKSLCLTNERVPRECSQNEGNMFYYTYGADGGIQVCIS
ncbi:sodium channel and clathrin linker 1 [Lasius niger]|uniref:Sodium channel and clathrin linker 1 n=1 Tax=Lasius niger TaxID=67767 RepID=A0A0J7N4E1_LASNI|nr:sodium channel and clathrin linker 1 [Lasius niger]